MNTYQAPAGLGIGHVHLKVSDLGRSEAFYRVRDPDGNGIELYWDLPRAEWPQDAQGGLEMVTEPLDLVGLLAEAR